MAMELKPCHNPLVGSLIPPGDKSVTHRAVLFSALAAGTVRVYRPLVAADTLSSRRLVERLGVVVHESPEEWILTSPGLLSWKAVSEPIDCGNSGTTMRLAMGLLATSPHPYTLTGDASLSLRPMERVALPLRMMGAEVETQGGHAPVRVRGGQLHGLSYTMPVASAQVKSALLLAASGAAEKSEIIEPYPTRDHTERMLRAMGAAVQTTGCRIAVSPSSLHPVSVSVPSDPSSAAFWAALAALIPHSRIVLRNLALSPRRTGFYRVLGRMGAVVKFSPHLAEPDLVGDVEVAYGPLKAVELTEPDIPDMIDEVSLIGLLSTQALGTTVISGAGELRLKESDRIAATVDVLGQLGAEIRETADGMVIHGPQPLHGGRVEARGDHRIAMMAAVAAAVASGPIVLEGEQSVAISYPEFFHQYRQWQEGHWGG